MPDATSPAVTTPSVRRATMADAELLAELGARTFRDAFAADNRPEDLAAYLAATYDPALQRGELADPTLTYLVAEAGGEAVGYAMVRAGGAPACVTGPAPIEVARLYVSQAWHGRGVAQALMAACEAEARRREGQTLWLGVWERNPRAIAFYTKCGFVDVGSKLFVVGSDPQTDRVLAHALGTVPGPTGTAAGGGSA